MTGGASAILFPGQGSHCAGMRELAERHVPQLAELAIELCGGDPYERAAESTRFAQPAIVTASLAAYVAAGSPAPAYFAGHSLGELSALAAGGAIRREDAVRLAVERGRLTDEVVRSRPGGMLAVLGDGGVAREVAAVSGLTVANDNGPTQVVLAGPTASLAGAARAARARGAKTVRLAIAGAFHSPAIEPAVAPFRRALRQVEVSPPAVAVLSCSLVAPLTSPEVIRDVLAQALVRPVRWRETLIELRRRGVRRFLDAGPGEALSRMVERCELGDVDAAPLATGRAERPDAVGAAADRKEAR